MYKLFIAILLLGSGFNICTAQQGLIVNELKEKIAFLTYDKNLGRYPGVSVNKKIVCYIKKDLKKSDILPYLKYWEQAFTAQLRMEKGVKVKKGPRGILIRKSFSGQGHPLE